MKRFVETKESLIEFYTCEFLEFNSYGKFISTKFSQENKKLLCIQNPLKNIRMFTLKSIFTFSLLNFMFTAQFH
jgi:hypothetical protein